MTIYDKINRSLFFGTNKRNKSILFDLVKSIEDATKLQQLDLHKEVYIVTQESNNKRRFNINGLEKSI